LTRLINPESLVELQDHLTLEDAGMPSEHALKAGVIQLYAQKLKKVVVADELQIAPGEVTNSKLTVLCDSIRDDPPDILVLCGCRRVTNISCVVQLSTISHLDISSCSLGGTGVGAGVGAQGGFHMADIIKDMGGTLVSLNISSNSLGQLTPPEGWRTKDGDGISPWIHTDGREVQHGMPEGSKPDCIIAIANVIPDMGALMRLDISKNGLHAAGTKALTQGLKGNHIMTELNISSNDIGPSGAFALANAIPDMRALTALDLSSNKLAQNLGGGKYDLSGAL
jgi:hypothetical protein